MEGFTKGQIEQAVAMRNFPQGDITQELLTACKAAKNSAHFGYPGEPRPPEGRVYITDAALERICAAIARAEGSAQ